MFEFVSAAADIFFRRIQGKRVVRLDRVAGLARGLRIDADLAGEDGAPGFFAAVAKAAFNQGLVESNHGRFRSRPAAYSRVPPL